MAKRTKKKPFRYPGTLGRPLAKSKIMRKVEQHLAVAPSDIEGATSLGIDELAGHRRAVLAALFAFYRINADESDAWEQLAIKLVATHVPAWTAADRPRGGRPKKAKVLAARRRRGAPKVWTLERYEELNRVFAIGALVLMRDGKRHTNVAALEAGICELMARGKAPGWTKSRARSTARQYAPRLSECQAALRNAAPRIN